MVGQEGEEEICAVFKGLWLKSARGLLRTKKLSRDFTCCILEWGHT